MAQKYDPSRDAKVQKALAALEDILSDDFLPRDIQVQRMAHLRDFAREKVLQLKA